MVPRKTIEALVDQLCKCMDPFAARLARHFKTGEAIHEEVVKGLFRSTETGGRIKRKGDDRVSFFKPIQKPKIKTGLEKPKKSC